MLRAQITVAEANGAAIVRETVLRIETVGDGALLELTDGSSIRARDVVVAAGAFTGFHELLPRPLPFRTETETIVLGRVSGDDGERLGGEPTVVYLVDDPEISDLYMTPPIRYPDGELYVKAGCEHDLRHEPGDAGRGRALVPQRRQRPRQSGLRPGPASDLAGR